MGDTVAAHRLRETVQAIAANLVGTTSIPGIAAQARLLEEVREAALPREVVA